MLSNKRGFSNPFETLSDGTLITITSNGTLANHFPSYFDTDNEDIVTGFTLQSDTVENNNYPIGDINSNLNNNADIQQTIYGYDKNQLLLNSDRITINSKLDDIFVSSIKDIYIGAGENLSLTSPKSLNIVSNNVNIGDSKKEGVIMESMVLGDKLLEILSELFTELKAATSLFYGSPLPLMDQTGGTPLSVKLSTIEAKLKDLLSKKHKIEQG